MPMRNLFFVLALMLLMTACLDDDDIADVPANIAYVSLYHALPTVSDLDIIVDGNRINTRAFSYGDWSGYLNFFTGNRSISFRRSGEVDAVIDTMINLVPENAYSLFAVPGDSGPEAIVVVDSASAPAEGKAMLRFAHFAADTPDVTLSVGGDSSSPLFDDAVYKSVSSYYEVDAGLAELVVTGSDALVINKEATLSAGQYYTVVLQGLRQADDNENELGLVVLP